MTNTQTGTPAHPVTHLLYLHGFRSSPRSTKARLFAEVIGERFPGVRWWCPQLPPSPAEAMRLVADGTEGWPRGSCGVVGSSLGGYYAHWVAERLLSGADRAVLLNPAIDPARDLSAHIGTQQAWHDPEQTFDFTRAHVDELRALHPGTLSHPERYMAVIAKGDEVLDWREMAARHAGCHVRLVEGSDHALSDFDQHLDAVLAFLGLPQGGAARAVTE